MGSGIVIKKQRELGSLGFAGLPAIISAEGDLGFESPNACAAEYYSPAERRSRL